MSTGPGSAPEPKLDIKPLLCPRCSGAVPLTDGDGALCPYCGASVPIPESYRKMRDANRIAEVDRARVEAAYTHLGKPPRRMLRLWIGVAKNGLRIAKGPLSMLLLFGFLLPFILDQFVFEPSAPALGVNVVDVLGPFWYALAVTAAFELVFIAPFIILRYKNAQAWVRCKLAAGMAARPPSRAGGPAQCRACGAPLAVASGAIGVRCGYCGADNLVALPAEWVARFASGSAERHAQIDDALEMEAMLMPAARRASVKSSAWAGLLLIALTLCWWKWLSHVSRPDWRDAVAQSPRSIRVENQTFRVAVGTPGDSRIVESEPDYLVQFWVPLREGETLRITSPDFPSHNRLDPESSGGMDLPRSRLKRDPQAHAMVGAFRAPYSGWFDIWIHGDWATEPQPPPGPIHLQLQIDSRGSDPHI